ncbi:MAG: thioredoxin family protein [Methanosarcinaceae archaeon]|nr:thioredoxin family protein [Methanosarcinaceae archaeon]
MNRKILQLIFFITMALLLSGCVDDNASDADVPSQERSYLTEVTVPEDINRSLASGPVLVEMGYEGCPACDDQQPILEEIAADYQEKAAVLHIDTRNAGPLALWFGADYVPDSFVIVDIEDGQYAYMRADGQMTTDRKSARFVGLAEKEVLMQALDRAIDARQEN